MRQQMVFADPAALDPHSREGRAAILGAISHFLRQPEALTRRLFDAGVRELTVPGDFPAEVRDLFALFHDRYSIDTTWQGFFDMRNYAQSRHAGFTLRNVSSGLTFTVKKVGQKAKIYKVSGAETYHSFLHYSGALEYDQDWFEDQNWWEVSKQTVEFGTAFYRARADYAYGLITALIGAYNTAWQAGTTELDRDIATINTACVAIVTALEALKVPVDEGTRFVLRAPLALKARLNRALGTGYQFPAQTGQRVEFSVDPAYTTRLTGTNYYIGVPGQKNIWGDRMDLTVLTELDKLAWAQLAVGHSRFVGVIGEQAQLRRCATV